MSGTQTYAVCPECNNQEADAYWCSEMGDNLSCKKCGFDSGWKKSDFDKAKKYLKRLSHAELVAIQNFVFDMIDYKYGQENKEDIS